MNLVSRSISSFFWTPSILGCVPSTQQSVKISIVASLAIAAGKYFYNDHPPVSKNDPIEVFYHHSNPVPCLFSKEPHAVDINTLRLPVLYNGNEKICVFKQSYPHFSSLHPGDQWASYLDAEGTFEVPCWREMTIKSNGTGLRHGICVQYVPPEVAKETGYDLRNIPSKELQKMALLDVIIHNWDRSLGHNFLVGRNKLIPFDHDLADVQDAIDLTKIPRRRERGRYKPAFLTAACYRGPHGGNGGKLLSAAQIQEKLDPELASWLNGFKIETAYTLFPPSQVDGVRLRLDSLREILIVREKTIFDYFQYVEKGLLAKAFENAHDQVHDRSVLECWELRYPPQKLEEKIRTEFFEAYAIELRALLDSQTS